MEFTTKKECVYLTSDSGVFANDDGQKFEWYKVVFADPLTFENHELGFKPNVNFDGLNKGDRILIDLVLEPTNKKSRVLVSNFRKSGN